MDIAWVASEWGVPRQSVPDCLAHPGCSEKTKVPFVGVWGPESWCRAGRESTANRICKGKWRSVDRGWSGLGRQWRTPEEGFGPRTIFHPLLLLGLGILQSTGFVGLGNEAQSRQKRYSDGGMGDQGERAQVSPYLLCS